MFNIVKIFLYKIFPLKMYLLIMHYGFVFLYKIWFLLFFRSYKQHYYIRKYIKKWDVVLDVWANLGHYTYIFSKKVGSNWKIFAVEPVSIFSQILRICFKLKKNVIIVPFALWNQNLSSIKLGIESDDLYIRTGLPRVITGSSAFYKKRFQYIFDSSMVKGSQYFSDLEDLNYLKIDVEGYEMNILSDMLDIIKKYRPILQIEVNEKNYQDFFSFIDKIDYFFDTSGPKWDFIALPKKYA